MQVNRDRNKGGYFLFIPFLILCLNCTRSHERQSPVSANGAGRTSPGIYGLRYKWKSNYDSALTVFSVIDPPPGYAICTDSTNKFGEWLQHLPLRKSGSPVLLYNGQPKRRQDVHFAVLDIDAGTKDLQQCADAVMRLRAEFLYGTGRKNEISFNYTSGDKIPFRKWAEGFRPVVKGNAVTWKKAAAPGSSYPVFKDYLRNIFSYAGSKSLSRELAGLSNFNSIKAGDVLVAGGFPGHAMIVIETAQNKKTGKKIFMLAQSYMPAQDIHIVKNLNTEGISPWFEIPEGDVINTPEWTFRKDNLMRWP